MAGGGEPDATVTVVRLQARHPHEGPVRECEVGGKEEASLVTVDGSAVEVIAKQGNRNRGKCTYADGRVRSWAVLRDGAQVHVLLDGRLFVFEAVPERARSGPRAGGFSGDVSAPMPGRVIQVLATAGQEVKAGEPLVILESMKMELIIDAPGNATVKRVAVAEGDLVDRGMGLVELEPTKDHDQS